MPDTKTITVTDLSALIMSKMEATEPADTILHYFETHDGKGWSVRHLDKLRTLANDPTIRIRQIANMTSIEWGGYSMSGGNHGGSVLIAYAIKNVTIDAAFLLKHNPAFYDARDTRNAQRQTALANPALLEGVVTLINQRLAYLNEIEKIDAKFKALVTDWGTPLNVSRSEIEKLAGVK